MEKILSSEMAVEEINKLNEKRNAIAEQIEEKRGVFESSDVETREAILNDDIPALQNEVEEIDKQIAEVEEARAKFEEQEERMSLVKNVETVKVEARKAEITKDNYDTPEYRSAWVNYVKTGNDAEVRALLTSTDNIPVPTLMQGYVETAWERYGKFSRLVSKSYVKGYLSIPVEASATGAVWHDEGADAPAEEALTFAEILLQPKMIKKWIRVSDEAMALVPDEFMRYLADELVYRVVLELDESIIRGNADANGKGVVGIIGNANTLKVDVALGFNAINEAVAQLATFDNLTVAMNPQTFFGKIMGLTDLQGRPIYQIAADNTGKPQYYINGLKIEFTNAIPAYDAVENGSAWAVVGDFKGYKLNLPEGESVITVYDPYSQAEQDMNKFVSRLFAAGNITRLKHFAQLNKAAA